MRRSFNFARARLNRVPGIFYLRGQSMKCIKCEKEAHAKGLCNSHYSQERGWALGLHRKKTVCENTGCESLTTSTVCYRCEQKIIAAQNYRGYVYTPQYSQRGKHSYNWKGGVMVYPNHYIFKMNRLILIEQEHGKCQKCGEPYKHVHHIDGDKSNHSIDNLMVLCIKCHFNLHYPFKVQDNKKYNMAYYQEHKTKMQKYAKDYYKRNKERRREYQLKWRKKHPDYMKNYKKNYKAKKAA